MVPQQNWRTARVGAEAGARQLPRPKARPRLVGSHHRDHAAFAGMERAFLLCTKIRIFQIQVFTYSSVYRLDTLKKHARMASENSV